MIISGRADPALFMRVIATWSAPDVACVEKTQRFPDREYTILPRLSDLLFAYSVKF